MSITETTDTIDQVDAECLSAGDVVFLPGYDRQVTIAGVVVYDQAGPDDDLVVITFDDADHVEPMVVLATAPWHVVERSEAKAARIEAEQIAETKRLAEVARVEAYVTGLRDLADWFEAHPDLTPSNYMSADLTKFVTAEELPVQMRAFGAGDKVATDYSIGIVRRFGPHSLGLKCQREQVCTKVETGEVKTETKTADPKAEVPDGARNVRTVTETRVVYEIDEPVVEWECPDTLLGLGEVDGAETPDTEATPDE